MLTLMKPDNKYADVLNNLVDIALVQSTDSSDKIEVYASL